MSDSQRCRATAARYARLAGLTQEQQIRQSYLELESIWLQMASWTDKLNLQPDESARQSLYDLLDVSEARSREIMTSVH